MKSHLWCTVILVDSVKRLSENIYRTLKALQEMLTSASYGPMGAHAWILGTSCPCILSVAKIIISTLFSLVFSNTLRVINWGLKAGGVGGVFVLFLMLCDHYMPSSDHWRNFHQSEDDYFIL